MQLALQQSSGMSDLTNLKILKLHRCKEFRPGSLQKFLMQNNKLVELTDLLSLREFVISDIDQSFFDGLVQYMQLIKELDLYNCNLDLTSYRVCQIFH